MSKPRFRKDVYRWDWASESWYLRSWVRWINPRESVPLPIIANFGVTL